MNLTPINLISDTVTKPSPEMLQAMFSAEVGDDVFGVDPSINQLQEMAAKMFGKDAALFCPSGTMTNQIAIKVHTKALDEIICDHYSHVYQYETAGYAYNARVGVNLIKGENGKITAQQVRDAVKLKYDWLPISRLVVLENSCNKGGGTYYTLDELKEISSICKELGLILHLDGARLFNVLVVTQDSTASIGELFDSISICLSKGLGAPVGSLLIGNQDFIAQARRFRKVMGGGMRQAGYLAAAGIYALENNVNRLKDDNDRAKQIAEVLANQSYVKAIRPVQTNILIFDLRDDLTADQFIAALKEQGILASAFGPKTVRFVTHLDFTDEMMTRVVDVLKELEF